MILEHDLEEGSTVTVTSYTEIIELKSEAGNSQHHRSLPSKGLLLLQDNICAHCVAAAIEATTQLTFELLPHPPYTPDFGSSDYRMFVPLKGALLGGKFASIDGVKDMVHTCFRSQPNTFFADGARRLVNCYKICT
jgi:histone-lysine N-methyltransferase SETMAR